VCGGTGITDDACDCSGNVYDECGVCGGDGSSCASSSWTDLTAIGGDNQISLSWSIPDGERSGSDSDGHTNRIDSNSPVSLEIQNVDIDAGILDIYMINEVEVGAFQFQLFGITVTGASGGSAEEAGFLINTSVDNSNSPNILAFSLTGATIDPGEGLLITVSFSDFEGSDICFSEGEDNSCEGTAQNVISDAAGGCISTGWGDCSCSADNPADECGVCGGPGIADDACDCDGNLPDIECGEGTALEGQLVCIESDCAGISYNVYRDDSPTPLSNVSIGTNFIDSGLGYSETHCYTVTEVSAGTESDQSSESCATTNEMPDTPGCIFETACNYDPNATDTGDCFYDIDCAGVCV
jgi:hypothetical protein